MSDVSARPRDPRPSSIAARPVDDAGIAALVVFAIALVVYLRTLLPGPSVGDWAEMQWIPARLSIPHPTGYPLYVVLGWLFSLIPLGSLAWRAELLSAVAAAAAAATTVLIAVRLGVRPLVALAVALSLAVTGELWLEATFSEMNGLHLLLMAAVIHRALVWRAERRDRDVLLGALLAGLSLANHALAVSVVPFVILFVLGHARNRLRERPILLLESAGLFVLGLSPYLLIPIRALFGPSEIYAKFLTWDGITGLITGAELRGQMHFTLGGGIGKTLADVPAIVDQFVQRSNVVFVVGGFIGSLVHLARDRSLWLLFSAIVGVNLYLFANYVGDLDHYLLISWLILAVWLGTAVEALIAWTERRARRPVLARAVSVLSLALPLAIVTAHWPTYDQSDNRDGARFADSVFAALPPHAVLVSYWDALTTLGYEHCVDGRRPDVALRALDPTARIVCDPATEPLEDVARERPVYALFAAESELRAFGDSFRLVAGPVLAVPYGKRGLDHTATLYRLERTTP